jgi:hypothetical protein
MVWKTIDDRVQLAAVTSGVVVWLQLLLQLAGLPHDAPQRKKLV